MKIKMAVLMLFGAAFAFVEAAVVSYLRLAVPATLSGVTQPYRIYLNLGVIAFISPLYTLLGNQTVYATEMVREFATIVMLASIAYLAGTDRRTRTGAFLIAFAVWDIFYYVFLRLITGWPTGLFDIDVFFLLPVPWIGPVITAVVSSLLLFMAGTVIYSGSTRTRH